MDERAELDRLRAEVTELRSRPTGAAATAVPVAAGRRGRGRWRTPVAAVLIMVGCVLAPVSVLAVWTANQVSNTDRYVANVAPLIHEPAIQSALTDKITNAISAQLHLQTITNQAATALSKRGLPTVGTLLHTFSGSLASAVNGFIHSSVAKIVASKQVAQLWVQVNRTAHQELVKALSGQGSGAISISNGQVSLDLAPFITVVKQDLSAKGFTLVDKIPAIHPTLALFSSRELVKAQGAYRFINDLKIVLPILVIVLLGLGVYLARDHRRGLIGAGFGLALSMLLLAVALAISRTIYLNSVPSSALPSNAAAAAFDTLVRFIGEGLRALLALGLVVAIAAFFTGSSVTAVRTRRALASGLGRVREAGEHAGLSTGPAGLWIYLHRTGLRIAAVALAILTVVLWSRPTGLVVVLIAVALLVLLGVIELIARPPALAPARPQAVGHHNGGLVGVRAGRRACVAA